MRRPRPDGGFTSCSWQAPPPPFSVLWLSSGNSERAKKRRGGSARPRSMRRPRPDGGFLTIWMLGLCLLLLVLGGASLDLWRAFSQRQALAGLADAAALAGASGIDRAAARRGVIRLDPAEATSLANRSIEVRDLVDATYPLDKAITAFGHAQRSGALKVLVQCRQ